jgi:hypothetical protein
MKTLTDQQWYNLADHATQPVELTKGVVDEDFYIYDREFGYFKVMSGHHQIVMAILYTFRKGFNSFFEYSESVGSDYDVNDLADEWLYLPGTCFFSSMGTLPCIWDANSLNSTEKRILGGLGFRHIGEQ